MSPDAELARGIADLGLSLSEEAQHKLLAYLNLLEKWNRIYNLTAVRDRPRMITHHLLDCLAVVPHVSGQRVADVGSGAGLPGIPLAIAWPRSRFTLFESNHKKCSFLRQAALELGLENVSVAGERVEQSRDRQAHDLVITRAFADLADFCVRAGHLCAADGVMAAMKGVHPHRELAQVPAGYRVDSVVSLAVPGLNAQRHLVRLVPC